MWMLLILIVVLPACSVTTGVLVRECKDTNNVAPCVVHYLSKTVDGVLIHEPVDVIYLEVQDPDNPKRAKLYHQVITSQTR